jgi:hypothetical protein
LTLALLIVGALCVLGAIGVALRSPDYTSIIVAFQTIAAIIFGFILYNFYYEVIVKAREAAVTVEQNKDFLNSVQSAALYLTDIIQEMNDYALLHSNEIVAAIHKAREAFAGMPLEVTEIPSPP